MTNYCSRLLGLTALDSGGIDGSSAVDWSVNRRCVIGAAKVSTCLHSAMTNAERIFRHVESYFKACHSPLMPTRSEHSFRIFVNFNSSMTKRILFSTNYDEKRSRLAEHERKEFINHRDGGVLFCAPSSVRQICLQSASPHPHNCHRRNSTRIPFSRPLCPRPMITDSFAPRNVGAG